MAGVPLDTIVEVHPFDHNRDGDDVIISRPDREVLLCIPQDGLYLLQSLADGHAVGEVASRYEQAYGQRPDIDDFLRVLADEGFVVLGGDGPTTDDPAPVRPVRRGWSFDWITPAVAKRFCGGPALVVCGLLIALGVTLAVNQPAVLPGATVLLFPDGNFAILTVMTLVLAIAALMLHELAHAVVARSLGVSTRLALGNLMYTLVAQTDISAIWMAPKRNRYLAFMSGTIVDLVMASLIVDLLWADRHGLITLSPTVARPLLSALLFTYFARISFQFLFYLRTDVYYVVATAMSCKNLMSDTAVVLRNLFLRAVRRPDRMVDQSGIPHKEMRRIRWYAGFWLVGRVFWLGVLFFFYIPVLMGYGEQFVLLATGRPHRFAWIDFVAVAGLVFLVDGGGIVVWLRSIYRGWRERRNGSRRRATATHSV